MLAVVHLLCGLHFEFTDSSCAVAEYPCHHTTYCKYRMNRENFQDDELQRTYDSPCSLPGKKPHQDHPRGGEPPPHSCNMGCMDHPCNYGHFLVKAGPVRKEASRISLVQWSHFLLGKFRAVEPVVCWERDELVFGVEEYLKQ